MHSVQHTYFLKFLNLVENVDLVTLKMRERVFSYFERGEDDTSVILKSEEGMCASYLETYRARALVILEVESAVFACGGMPHWQVS